MSGVDGEAAGLEVAVAPSVEVERADEDDRVVDVDDLGVKLSHFHLEYSDARFEELREDVLRGASHRRHVALSCCQDQRVRLLRRLDQQILFCFFFKKIIVIKEEK